MQRGSTANHSTCCLQKGTQMHGNAHPALCASQWQTVLLAKARWHSDGTNTCTAAFGQKGGKMVWRFYDASGRVRSIY